MSQTTTITKEDTVQLPEDLKEKFMPKQDYEHAIKDLQATKSKYKELEEKVKQFETQREELEVKSLREKEEWKKLAEIKENEALDLKKKLESKDKLTSTYFKRAEVRAEAVKAGVRESALDDLDLLGFDGVEIESTSSGKINVLGAGEFVERIKATKPHWFEDKKAPSVTSTTPGVTKGKSMQLKDILKLQKEGKQAEYEAALNNYRKGR